jgi:hypothetical protein
MIFFLIFTLIVNEKLNKITFYGFALCLVLPIMEVKYRYIHGDIFTASSDPGIFVDIWNGFTEHWDDINFLFGFHPALLIIPISFLIEGIIFFKSKKSLNRIGHFLDHYLTYTFLFVAIGINLFLIDYGYDNHLTKFYFWFGAYIFFGLIVINIIVKITVQIRAKKRNKSFKTLTGIYVGCPITS